MCQKTLELYSLLFDMEKAVRSMEHEVNHHSKLRNGEALDTLYSASLDTYKRLDDLLLMYRTIGRN